MTRSFRKGPEAMAHRPSAGLDLSAYATCTELYGSCHCQMMAKVPCEWWTETLLAGHIARRSDYAQIERERIARMERTD